MEDKLYLLNITTVFAVIHYKQTDEQIEQIHNLFTLGIKYQEMSEVFRITFLYHFYSIKLNLNGI